VVQVIKSLQDPLEVRGIIYRGSVIMSGNEAWNRNVFKRWRKVDRRGNITLSDRLFQMVGPATGKARPPTAPAEDWSEQSGGNVDQADRRHEPVDSDMTARFHEWPCT